MTDALALGEKLLALLESARTTTYKPALLLALIDRAQEYSERESIPVRALAERVIELPLASDARLSDDGPCAKAEPDQHRPGCNRPGDSGIPRTTSRSVPGFAASDPTRAGMGAACDGR